MALINQTTNLKSLRYGKDRIGGGSSNQPYIKSDIPDGENGLGRKGGPDFLLRGGLLTPGRVVNDVSRLTQMFFDFKSPNGLLFTAKQNILSRSAVATNGDGKALNEGIYLPTSTILQAAGNPFGVHLNKQGLDPTKRTGPNAGQNGLFDLLGITDPLGLPTYKSIVKLDSKSRLEEFLDDTINKESTGNLYSYSGGPGSILGIGKTNIPLPLPLDRTGINNTEVKKFKFANVDWFNLKYTEGDQTKIQEAKLLNDPIRRFEITNDQDNRVGASLKYVSEINRNSFSTITSGFGFGGKFILGDPNQIIKKSSTFTLSYEQLSGKNSSRFTPGISEDFREETGNPNHIKTVPYLTQNIEQRVNLGDPGKKLSSANPKTTPLDKITATPLYRSTTPEELGEKNDLVKFRIGVINNDNPAEKTYIHFRAFLDGMNDSYSSDWQAQKFMGRGENFYRYNGFDRKISLSWTVVAQSKLELIPMYQKLNYLASVCAPDYSDIGYMRGNLITLTIGGYLYEQVGIMTGITYDVPQESPWEIAIPHRENLNETGPGGILSDSSVKELPHMIKVTGFNFIPIHNFVPRVQQNSYKGDDGKVDGYGGERYIALSKGTKANQSNYGPIFKPQ